VSSRITGIGLSLDYATLEILRRQHPAWRLLLSEHAALIASFLHKAFVSPNVRMKSAADLAEALEDELFGLREQLGTETFPRSAMEYLNEWPKNLVNHVPAESHPTSQGGVDDGTRTRDGRNHNPGLYQLSYVHHHRTSDFSDGAPGRNRTCNRRLRRPVLYPVELRALYKSTCYSAKRNLSGRCRVLKQTESEVRADYIGVCRVLKRPMAFMKDCFRQRISVSPERDPIADR
jgi:hypothetical protein